MQRGVLASWCPQPALRDKQLQHAVATYGVDGEGRTATLSMSNGANPLTGTTRGINGTCVDASCGQITNLTFSSAASANYTYDANTGRMKSFNQVLGSTPESGTLTWNQNGSLQQLVISDPQNSADSQTCKYSADDLLRLVSVACGTPWAQTFTYDAFGNVKQSGSGSFQPNYTTSNQISDLSGFSYDLNGNLLGDATHTYGWNLEPDGSNKPALVDSNGLTYDALGRMVDFYNGGTHRQYVYTAGVEAVMNGATLASVRLPMPNAMYIYYPGVAGTRWIADWQGSFRFGSNTSNTAKSQAFSPFGDTYAGHNVGTLSVFAGIADDTVSDLYDADSRRLSFRQGRWISPDPAGVSAVDFTNPQSLNRYGWIVQNNWRRMTHADGCGTS